MSDGVPARWYDGRGGRVRAARLRRDAAGGWWLEAEGLGAPRALAAGEVALSPRLGHTPRTMRLADGGQLEVDDAPALDALFPSADRVETLGARIERLRGVLVGASLTVLLSLFVLWRWGLPAAADVVAERLPAAVEQGIGRQGLALMDQLGLEPTRLDPGRQAALRAQMRTLARGLAREGDLRLEFRRGGQVGANAFALPGGTLVMTDELVALAADDVELRAVLAHEIGHHERRHVMRGLLQDAGLVVVVGMLFGDVAGGTLVASVPVFLLESGYSRDFEREADAFAHARLAAAGESPAAMGWMLERLHANAGRPLREAPPKDGRAHPAPGEADGDGEASPGSWIASHPDVSERVANAEAAARDAGFGVEAPAGGEAKPGR